MKDVLTIVKAAASILRLKNMYDKPAAAVAGGLSALGIIHLVLPYLPKVIEAVQIKDWAGVIAVIAAGAASWAQKEESASN